MRYDMSVGSVGKWFALSVLVGAAAMGATGCKDDGDDDTEVMDAGKDAGGGGGGDAGPLDSSVKDTGTATDSGGGQDAVAPVCPAVATCAGEACTNHTTSAGTWCGNGCAKDYKDAEVCGIQTLPVFGPDSGAPAYLHIHAPGVDSTSCGVFLDAIDTQADGGLAPADASTKGNMKQDRFVTVGGMAIQISTPGCCTPLGYCSGNSDKGEADFGGAKIASNGGFGCMQADAFLRTLPESARRRCDPDSGMILPAVTADGGTDGGTDAGAGDAATDASADAAGG